MSAMTPRAEPATATHQSLALISHLARVALRGSEAALEPSGLRPRHVVALTILRDHGAMTQGGLADALRLDPSNLVGLLNELEERELLVRRRDQGDRRRHIVEVSPAGRDALGQAERALASVQDDVLAALDEGERTALYDLLLRAAGGRLPAGACASAISDDACAASTES
jgi:DNA-binding MarR family transcriptional regulator